MRQKSNVILKVMLVVGDAIALILSFASAYFIRVHLDPRPYVFNSELLSFTISIVFLVPIMLMVLASLGLYRKSVALGQKRLSEVVRLMLAAALTVSALIVYDYLVDGNLFPVRVVAIMAVPLSFLYLVVERFVIRHLVRQMFKKDFAVKRAIIIGNHQNTEYLANYIAAMPECGYRLAGVVAAKKYIPGDLKAKQYSSLKEALRRARADVIFQTDEKSTKYVYKQALTRHLPYYFVPSETALSSHFGSLELIGNTPAVMVMVTPLTGGYVVTKRLFDIFISLVGIVLGAIPMAIVWVILKCQNPLAPAIYTSERLTQYDRKFKCYKFRSMRAEYSGMTPEQAFKKMGKPELIKKYRENGDQLEGDPRITKFGEFIRQTSLDELPQLFNILKGDISLIGPRALLPDELRSYGDRSLILSVKSGLTGFAQVSGRRNISFEERRALDIYYVRNWSMALDAEIFFRTIGMVLKREGAE